MGANNKIDILIVDEAHKIEDGNRGILLQQKIEDVVKANSSIKVFFLALLHQIQKFFWIML